MRMKFEWYEEKNGRNLAKLKVSLKRLRSCSMTHALSVGVIV